MFRSLCTTISRGLAISTLCSHQFRDQISPKQELRTHIQTDGNDIWPHATQTNNEHTSMESNLVTAQSTDREPPVDGHT